MRRFPTGTMFTNPYQKPNDIPYKPSAKQSIKHIRQILDRHAFFCLPQAVVDDGTHEKDESEQGENGKTKHRYVRYPAPEEKKPQDDREQRDKCQYADAHEQKEGEDLPAVALRQLRRAVDTIDRPKALDHTGGDHDRHGGEEGKSRHQRQDRAQQQTETTEDQNGQIEQHENPKGHAYTDEDGDYDHRAEATQAARQRLAERDGSPPENPKGRVRHGPLHELAESEVDKGKHQIPREPPVAYQQPYTDRRQKNEEGKPEEDERFRPQRRGRAAQHAADREFPCGG